MSNFPITLQDLISVAAFIVGGGLLVWLCKQFVFSTSLSFIAGSLWKALTSEKGLVISLVFILGGLIGFTASKIFLK